MTRYLHVASAQIHSGRGPRDVLKRAEAQVKAASAMGTHVILFPEAAIQGYSSPDLTGKWVQHAAVDINSPYCQAVSQLAERNNICILMGFFEKENSFYYNSVLVAQPNGIRKVQRKFNLTVDERKACLTPGPSQAIRAGFKNPLPNRAGYPA